MKRKGHMDMTANSFRYILRETLQSLKRNLWLSTASVATVMITMVILGFSVFLLANVSNWTKSFESQVEISAFVKDGTSQDELKNLQNEIEQMGNVASVTLVTKEEALSQLSQNSNEMLQDLGGVNPLPDMFTIKMADPNQVSDVISRVSALNGIDKVRYGKEFIDKLLSITQWVRWIGIGVIVMFAVASVALISINIKMTVFSRRKEIQIMKLVGASNSFIRWPFLIEGMVLGLLGGCIAFIIVWVGCGWTADYVASFLPFVPMVNTYSLFAQIFAGILLMGALIGVIGSAFSVRRFLKI